MTFNHLNSGEVDVKGPMDKTIGIFCLLSFTLTIDYSLSLISTEAYWTRAGGDYHLTGFIFGVYDALTIFVTPLLSIYIGKGGSYKKMFICGLIVNILGNVLYALAYICSNWIMILVGRTLAGLGATTLPMIMVYITNYMDSTTQKAAVGYTKYASAVTRMLGPALGSILTIFGASDKTRTIGFWGDLFNMYTLVGWIPVGFAIITIVVLMVFFKDVNVDEHQQFMEERLPINQVVEVGDVVGVDGSKYGSIFSTWPVLVLGFVSTFIYWMYMGNSFVITTHFYHVVDSEHQLWHIYITGFGGFTLAFVLFMVARNFLSGVGGLISSVLLLIVSMTIYLFKINAMFYVAVGMTTFAYAVMIPSINVYNNSLAKRNIGLLGNKLALAITLLPVFQSLARFVGPFMFVTFGATHSGENCNFEDPNLYKTSGCQIKNYYVMSGVYMSTAAICMLVVCVVILKKKVGLGA